MPRPTGRLLLLAVLLCAWEPLSLAFAASSDVAELVTDSAVRTAFLVFRLIVAAVGVAAGLALWNDRPHGLSLAKAALVLAALAALVRFVWFPGNTPPDLRLPYAAVLLGYNAAWFAYLLAIERA